MPALKTYSLFISHAWDYNDEYHRLLKMLDDARNFSWRNYSVPEHDPLAGGRTLSAQLERQIRPVNAVVILAGMYVNHRDWIQVELEMAAQLDKPMIGVRPWGNSNVPTVVTEYAETVVPWSTSGIIGAIRAYAI